MMFCPKCGSQIPDGATMCPNCGMALNAPQQPQQPQQGQPLPPMNGYQPMPGQQMYMPQPPMPEIDPKDHTAEFSEEEISKGKVFALSCYLFGFIGILLTYLGAKDNGFAMFHARQALLLTAAESLALFVGGLFSFLFFIPLIAAAIFCAVLAVVEIIMMVRIMKGVAKDAPIVGGMKLLN